MTILSNTATPTATTARGLSQFYTDCRIAADLVARTLARYTDDPFDMIIEPSAGAGAFSRHLGADCLALDLDPKAPEIAQADFLSWTPAAFTGRCLVIGNPPFGERAALAFLNHAAGFADVVAFILPASFRKRTMQNRIARSLHLVHEEEVPKDAFIHEGKTFHVPCVLQIWERRSVPRQLHALETTHPHFERCSQAEADLVIRRVGAHAGQLKPLDKSWSPQSNIFLRATGVTPDALKERFARLDMSEQGRNGAGGGSINMSEIVSLYKAALAEEAPSVATGFAMPMMWKIGQEMPAAAEPLPVDEAGPSALRATLGALALCLANEDLAAAAAARDALHVAAALSNQVVIDNIVGSAPTREAVARFNVAAVKAQSITIKVPLSFRKTSVQNRLDPVFHLVHDTDATVEVVGSNGRPQARRCAIQIWERRAELRPRQARETRHPDFEFCSRAEADFAIQRIGANAGRLKALEAAGSAQSHLFLRAVTCSAAELWARFQTIDFNDVRRNTAALPSVAKTEVVALYEAVRCLAATATAPTGAHPDSAAKGSGRAPVTCQP